MGDRERGDGNDETETGLYDSSRSWREEVAGGKGNDSSLSAAATQVGDDGGDAKYKGVLVPGLLGSNGGRGRRGMSCSSARASLLVSAVALPTKNG